MGRCAASGRRCHTVLIRSSKPASASATVSTMKAPHTFWTTVTTASGNSGTVWMPQVSTRAGTTWAKREITRSALTSGSWASVVDLNTRSTLRNRMCLVNQSASHARASKAASASTVYDTGWRSSQAIQSGKCSCMGQDSSRATSPRPDLSCYSSFLHLAKYINPW